MARFQCRWRNLLICVCCPCICMALLFVYVAVMLCMDMSSHSTPGKAIEHQLDGPLFVAGGNFRLKSAPPLPKTFWNLNTSDNPFWNRLQLSIDRHFNPLLRANITRRDFKNSTLHESVLRETFSEVIDSNGTSESLDKMPEQIQEFVRHMQKRDYHTIFRPGEFCGAGAPNQRRPTLLLLAIKTTELNFKNRQAIRQTWGQVGWVAGQKMNNSREVGGYVRRVFLVGKEEPDGLSVNISELLELENKHYGDILQWDFKDTFFNLTLKDVLFWDWFAHSCSRTSFVFKGDDDVFVNTPNMITYLHEQLGRPEAYKHVKDFMAGDVIGAAYPDRVTKSKYFIPESFFKGIYPAYAGGGGVVYSGILTKRLYRMSKRVHLYPIDDVYVGMLMNRLNAHPVHHPAFLTFDFPKKEEGERCSYHTVLLVHQRTPNQLVRLWADLKKTQTQCWNVPLRDGKTKGKKS